ncbi:Superinfection immunity protein [Microlunatus sagamiharensis]|uniref:Superinfection immunity protein n=1 Tax=Microlunatus sagamiharensis TaxID=546874 RepID=A0A1H2LNF7_9ACTN|nr:superinfection immunity protein [Microlunatus sagamiharensis]SDU82459.1 Superinfection immunity protein [Microlunatus sagamiharensis]
MRDQPVSYQPYGYLAPQTQVLVQPYRCSTAHVVIAWVLTALTGLYLLPWAVAATRNRSNVAATALINLFLGWTVIGWVVALVMACGSDRPVVVVQAYAPPALPHPPQPWAQTPQPWQQVPQPWEQAPRPAQPWSAPPAALAPRAWSDPEPTTVDPLGTEPTRPLPRSPWEPDHRG